MVSKAVLRLFVVLIAIGGFAYLFLRSATGSRAEPYDFAKADLAGWTLDVLPGAMGHEPVLALRPPRDLVQRLFNQVFKRAMESLATPAEAGMPLLLRSEFDQAFATRSTLEALQAVARDSGLATPQLEPKCLAYRRVSEPGALRQLYVASFEVSGFSRFRQALAAILEEAPKSGYDPAALSPVLLVATTDPEPGRWLPLRLAAEDCVAPIVVQ